MKNKFQDPEIIKKILKESKVLAVVGLSPKKQRPSHSVSAFLKSKGYKIIPVYPTEDKIFGERVYKKLIDIEGPVDTVVIFRKPEYVKPHVENAIKIQAKTVWMQEGIINKEAGQIAEENGLNVIMDRCMYKEYIKYM